MEQNIIHVKCDMCGAERDFGEHFNGENRWRHEVLVETHTTESHMFGYEKRELDLCPKCYGRCAAIKALIHEKRHVEEVYGDPSGCGKPTYTVTGIEYAWKQDEE